jgi:hypothetical protein
MCPLLPELCVESHIVLIIEVRWMDMDDTSALTTICPDVFVRTVSVGFSPFTYQISDFRRRNVLVGCSVNMMGFGWRVF